LFLAPFFAGASLSALDKTKDGKFDVRPIAAGELIRRLVAKSLCASQKVRAAEFFAPHQHGVACPAGAERVVHFVRQVCQKSNQDPDFVILKVDLRNAFNLVSRKKMLEIVTEEFPEVARWAFWCYGGQEGSHLWFDRWVLDSREGVQQGDPLGPLLFSLVIHKLVIAISTELSDLPLNKWYLDDGIMGGKSADIEKAYQIILERGPTLGLNLNPSKCELIWINRRPETDVFPPSLIRIEGNFEILGSPVGDARFCSSHVGKKCEGSAFRALAAIETVEDPQVAVMLVRLCASFCKVVHFLRSVPPVFLEHQLSVFDDRVHEGVERCVGLSVPQEAWRQATLSLSNGGLGVRSAGEHASAAYLASVSSASRNDGWNASEAVGWSEAVVDYNSRVDKEDEVSQEGVHLGTQHTLSRAIEKRQLASLLSEAGERDKARLLAVSSLGASKWLSVVPTPALNQAFTPLEFSTLLKLWLGMDVYPQEFTCPACQVTCMDKKGYHALTCKSGGHLGTRHNALRDNFYDACSVACLGPKRELPFLLPNTNKRPADVYLPNFTLGKPACLDFAVTHTQQPKYLKLASVTAGIAAKEYGSKVKDRKYAAECEEQGLMFVPMVTEVFGVWGQPAESVFYHVGKMCASRGGIELGGALHRIMQRLSVTLMRCNARALVARLDPKAKSLETKIREPEVLLK
jgi:hypothetical protein